MHYTKRGKGVEERRGRKRATVTDRAKRLLKKKGFKNVTLKMHPHFPIPCLLCAVTPGILFCRQHARSVVFVAREAALPLLLHSARLPHDEPSNTIWLQVGKPRSWKLLQTLNVQFGSSHEGVLKEANKK